MLIRLIWSERTIFCIKSLYFKTTCNIRPHFLVPKGGLKIEGPLYCNLPTDLIHVGFTGFWLCNLVTKHYKMISMGGLLCFLTFFIVNIGF